MDQMRTEFGISGAISMSDLYRGGSEVPSTATSNSGGTITKAALSGGGTIGVSGSYNTTTVEALPQTIAAGDTYATNSNIVSFVNTQNGGGFSGAATNIFFSNSSGTRVGNFLAQDVISSSNSFSGSRSTNKSFSGTVASNMVGATHFAYQVNGGGAQFQQESSVAQSSLTQGSLTLVQNRAGNVNTGVPTGGSGDTEFQFSDLYGATA
jgi:hypothetical protein